MNTNTPIQIVVLGQARVGKSFLGNKIERKSDQKGTKSFETSAGSDSCTTEIKSVVMTGLSFPGVNGNSDPRKFNITYTDTPGFPDTRGPEETIKVYNDIVHHSNKNKPAALVWLLNPSRSKDDIALFKTYSFLMKQFANKGIFCAILVNNQGDFEMDEEEEAQTLVEVRNILQDYDLLGNFVDREDQIAVSASSKKLVDVFLHIVSRASDDFNSRGKVSEFDSYQKIKEYYTGQFDQKKAVERTINEKRHRLGKLQSDLKWHEKRIEDLNIAIAACSVASFFTFGLSGVAADGMQIAVEDSKNKVKHLKPQIDQLQNEIDNLKEKEVMKIFEKLKKEFETLQNALKLNNK